jgi:hypothetical protein
LKLLSKAYLALAFWLISTIAQAQEARESANMAYFPDAIMKLGHIAISTDDLASLQEPALPPRADDQQTTWRLSLDETWSTLFTIRIEEELDQTGTAYLSDFTQAYYIEQLLASDWPYSCESLRDSVYENGDRSEYASLDCTGKAPPLPKPDFTITKFVVSKALMRKLRYLSEQGLNCTEPFLSSDDFGLDGSQWLIERSGQGSYCISQRWSPKGTSFAALGIHMGRIVGRDLRK